MNHSYQLHFPDEIVFGPGTLASLPDQLPSGGKVLLVTGYSAQKNGLLDRLSELLRDFSPVTVCGIAAEPPLDEADRLIELGRQHQVTAVVAVGGGSVMDAAKTAAALIPAGGKVRDYFDGRRKITVRGLFCAALPTTAGTGAEITPNAVFIEPVTQVKRSIRHRFLVPDLALVDPELTLSSPPAVTAASGMDALTQAIESMVSLGANHATEALAAQAVELIYRHLSAACAHPDDLAARTAMAEGSMLTAMAFSHSGLGAVHGIGHPVGSLLHLPHGFTCAVLLVPVMEWNLPAVRDKFTRLAQLCGHDSAEDFIAGVRRLRDAIGIPGHFHDAGLKPEHFPFVIANCRSGSMKANPRPMTDADVVTILQKLL